MKEVSSDSYELRIDVGRSVLHHRTGHSTIRTLIKKTGSKILRTSTEAKFRPYVDSLLLTDHRINEEWVYSIPPSQDTQGEASIFFDSD